MKVSFRMENENTFRGIIDFYKSNAKVQCALLPSQEIDGFANEYNEFVNKSLQNHIYSNRSWKIFTKAVGSAIKNMIQINQVIRSYVSSIFTRSVITVDGFSDNPFAKSIIYNKTYCSNIINPDYIASPIRLALVKIHNCNLYLVSKFLLYRINKIISDIQLAINFIVMASVFISVPGAFTFIFSYAWRGMPSYSNIIIYYLVFIAIPNFFLWVLPVILQYTLRHRLKELFIKTKFEHQK